MTRVIGLAALGAAILVLAGCGHVAAPRDDADHRGARPAVTPTPGPPSPSDPAPPASQEFPLFSAGGFENAGYPTACRYTGFIADRGSLDQLRAAIGSRATRGTAELLAELRSLTPGDLERATQIHGALAYLAMYEGRFDDAAAWIARAWAGGPALPSSLDANLEALLGVVHLRRGETENCLECVGPSSCIFPLLPEAIHQRPSGSREAIRHFTAYLRRRPEDLGVRWLLNVAYMTLGEYPKGVPSEFLIPLDKLRPKLDVGAFENVAAESGIGARGPNMAGGSLFDDFDGDGRPDIVLTSFDTDLGAALFINRGDGTFEDRSRPSGLARQPMALNASHADFDNDGRPDIVLLRGGWENAGPMTLLRNKGGGAFEDITAAAGLAVPIASHAAAWGDFDNDGRVDLFVCGEFAADPKDGLFSSDNSLLIGDERNRCRLYRNLGDGTFVDVADKAGVRNDRYAKGAAWGDYDDDGRLDLYVSNFGADSRLYHNNGDGTFTDLGAELHATGPFLGFSCWFWDFDNDGRLDIYVTDRIGGPYDVAAGMLGVPTTAQSHPRLYRNLGPSGFRDVSRDVGQDRVALAMGSSFGDIDNDGFLDIYLGTGQPGFSTLMPNLLFKNVEGRRFEDVTTSSRTGHLQKGHGVSLADYDDDGDLDILVETGGAVPGDRASNALFRNPGHGRHWLKIKLVGTRTNRAALGARLRIDVKGADGSVRSIHRQVGGGSSYGGSGLVQHIGLGGDASVAAVEVRWPASGTRQVVHDLAADRTIEITEGSDSVRTSQPPRPAATPRP